MPRYAVKVSQIETRTKTLYVNAASAIEAVDIAHDSLDEAFVKMLNEAPASISYSFHDAHSVRDIQNVVRNSQLSKLNEELRTVSEKIIKDLA